MFVPIIFHNPKKNARANLNMKIHSLGQSKKIYLDRYLFFHYYFHPSRWQISLSKPTKLLIVWRNNFLLFFFPRQALLLGFSWHYHVKEILSTQYSISINSSSFLLCKSIYIYNVAVLYKIYLPASWNKMQNLYSTNISTNLYRYSTSIFSSVQHIRQQSPESIVHKEDNLFDDNELLLDPAD